MAAASASNLLGFLKACFAAGTKLLTKRGWLPIEEVQIGDEVWSKPEGEPGHAGGWKRVEQLFVRTGRIWHLHLGGELIRTTGEHPFYVVGKRWVNARWLKAGDLLYSHDGRTVAVEECYDTGEYETVYNCRVADNHTYFVGSEEWGFSVWAHNADYAPQGGRFNFSQQFQGMSNSQINQAIGNPQRQLLQQWMGTGAQGARTAAGRPLPQGLTADTLRAYHEVARRQIEAGLDTVGTQAARLELIEQALRALGH